jgi:ribosomal protein S12 methylthiotransferase accessory factor
MNINTNNHSGAGFREKLGGFGSMIDKIDFIDQIYELDGEDDCPIAIAAALLKPDKRGRRRVVSGRGLTRQEAQQSCFGEAIERWCAIFDDSCPGIWATEGGVAPAAISPEALMLISDRQYAHTAPWNRGVEEDHRLPERRKTNESLFWVETRSLADNSKVMAPAACCFLGYPSPLSQGFTVPDSSGLAAGADIATCVQRALFELIERDAVSIWWYGRIERPLLHLDRSDFPLLAAFETWLARQGRRVWLLDLTTDLGVVVAAALSCDENGRDLAFGFAAGRTPEEAGKGALGELVQFEATKGLSAKSDRQKNAWSVLAWCDDACIKDHPFLQAARSMRAVRSPEPMADMAKLIDVLHRKGIDPVMLDLSRDGLPFSVVRVLAPGLRPIWPRFAPGRLYDVPVERGWRQNEFREEELNPTPFIY